MEAAGLAEHLQEDGRTALLQSLPASRKWRKPGRYGTTPCSLFSPAFLTPWGWEMCGGFPIYARCTEEVRVVCVSCFLLVGEAR